MISSSEFSKPKSRQERQERRARLERESELVKAQIQELKNRLPQLYKGGPNGAPSKQGNVSKKRPAPVGGDLSGDNKRQRVELERARRVNSIWQQCHTILKGLSKSKDAHPFLKPVDVKYSKCPDYFEIIKHPMDLGTIQKKFPGKGKQALQASDPNTYSTPYEFRDDMRLVWSNCRTYNPPHVPVRNMGEAMSDAWEKRWNMSGIEGKWEEEQHRQNLEEQDLAGGGDIAQQMQINHNALVKKVAVSESNPGYAAPNDGLDMNFEQKRRLSIAIGQLPGDKISEVLRIIAEDDSMRMRADSEEEIEVDIDQLSTEILWKLDRFTRGVAQKVRKKAGSKPVDAQGSKPAPEAGTAAGTPQPFNGKEDKSGHHDSSSSSSEDSGTDRSESGSGSQGEVGSKDLGFNAKPAAAQGQRRPSEADNDAVTLISATTPAGQPQIVKTMALKKEVNLQNENAWADLGKEKGDEGDGEEGDEEDKDMLWDEFKSREQEEQQREKEKKAEEARQQQERQKKEEAARKEAEDRAKAAEAAKRAQKEEEAAKVKAQRDKEMEEIQNARGENFEAGAQELMDSKKQGDTLNVLGLQRKESSDEDSDDGSSS